MGPIHVKQFFAQEREICFGNFFVDIRSVSCNMYICCGNTQKREEVDRCPQKSIRKPVLLVAHALKSVLLKR
jgi:hypothetical protein